MWDLLGHSTGSAPTRNPVADAVGLPRAPVRGGLAPWQERRAKELLDAHIGGGITLDALARSCELSTRHFTRAFRQSTGVAPYQWLQYRRGGESRENLVKYSPPLRKGASGRGVSAHKPFTPAGFPGAGRRTGTKPCAE